MTTPRQKNPVTQFVEGKKFQFKGMLLFPHLLAPKADTRNGKLKFSCQFAFDPNANAQATQMFEEMLRQVKQQFHSTIPDHAWVNPLKDYNTYKRMDGKPHPQYLAGKKWFNASNTDKWAPQVMIVDQSSPNGMRPATQMDAIHLFSGQEAVISISCFGLHGENAKYGVSLNIDAVLIIGGGTKVVTEQGVDVNQAFSQFLGQMGGGGQAPAAQPPQTQPQTEPAPQYQQPQYQQPQQQYQQPAPTSNDPYAGQFNQQFGNNGGYYGGNNGNNGGGLV